MSKFNKFLDEENLAPTTRQKNENSNSQDIRSTKYTSLKINVNTLDTLRKVKLVTKEDSYSILIEKMMNNYINQLSSEEKNKIDLL